MFEWRKTNDAIGTTNRGNPAESGLCTLCRCDCKGKCEVWMSSLVGRKLLYPRDFGKVTAGSANTFHVGVSYNSIRIVGRLYGAKGLPKGVTDSPDDCIFPNVSIEGNFGAKVKTKFRIPIISGAMGSTFIAAKYWEPLAIGAALAGFPLVIGENVVGVDKNSVIEKGRIKKAPELERRIDIYKKYYDGYGAILFQMNVEDTRNGVAEYIIEKYGDDIIVELKWGQGAKSIGGEIQVKDLEYALFLKKRGYIIDPDPELPEVQEAFKRGAIKSFARHSRLGFTNARTTEEAMEFFYKEVKRLRKLGFKRITLKTGAYGMEALALAIKVATEAELDLLTIDGAGGGTGMSPWNMMEHWGVPSVYLHSKAYEYATILASKKGKVVDMAFGGGFAREDHIFKALALGAPFVKLVCLGRALLIPCHLGSNIEGVLRPERKEAVNGNWNELPPSVTAIGKTPEEIFACYYEVEKKVGKKEMKNIPFGAIALYTYIDKLSAGLQQLMAGARKFSLSAISRSDIVAANKETAEITGLPFITEAEDDLAKKILEL
ncbi:MAG: FMN-binding glutamate synthase family protein [Thermodesulfobacterium sp.]|nr:FMN-binding glutamate synthase family protein [Thermodesulfobacterium sp.]